jgi:ATP-binding cassette, subfamily B, bacterial MsbA
LRRQRKTIFKGLLCVLFTALTATGTALLVKYSIQAISDASQMEPQRLLDKNEVQSLANDLHKPVSEINNQLADMEQGRPFSPQLSNDEERRMADNLKISQTDLRDRLRRIYERRNTTTPLQEYPPLQRLGFWCIVVVAVYAVRYWFVRGVTYYLSMATNRLASDLRIKLFNKLQRLPISYFNEKRAGAIQSVLTNDVNVFQAAVTIVRDNLEGPVKMIGASLAILWLQWQLFLITLLIFPFILLVIQRNSKKMKQAQTIVQQNLSDVLATTSESLQGTRIIRSFSAEESVEDRYEALVERSFASQMRAVGFVARLRPAVELIGAVGLAAVLFLCGVLASTGSLLVADIAATLLLLDIINQGFRNLASVNNTYAQVQAATNRIYGEILDVPEEHIEARGSQTIANPVGQIEFRNVSFTYPDGTEALRNVSFTIDPGKSLALVGPSGSGKSTIADLVLRFYDPSGGQILFDGVDIRDLDVNWLRNQIGVVPQQTFLFAGTISENIEMGNPSATPEEIKEAAIAAHADEFISEISTGYETPIHERGIRLSGGQMQRVAIARALVRKPKLLLLDEATSALDANAEQIVQKALNEIMQERTTLFIAHRLTTAARADHIVMLSHGQIIEQGSHKDLLAANGAYAGMFRAFNSGVLNETIA